MKKLAILKDLILFLVGLSGIIYQQVIRQSDIYLLVVFTTMIGVPGLTNIIQVVSEMHEMPRGNIGTELPLSSQVPEDSVPESHTA
jgi:hypothetical protein